MNDADLLALNAFQEANTEPNDALAAVCQVVLNRTALKYESDGTIQSTIFWPNAFSWTQWSMVNGKYTKVAFTPEEVQARAADLLARAQMYSGAWERAQQISASVQARTYSGPLFDKITPQTVLYVNLQISHPDWAIPENLVVTIGSQNFYHA